MLSVGHREVHQRLVAVLNDMERVVTIVEPPWETFHVLLLLLF